MWASWLPIINFCTFFINFRKSGSFSTISCGSHCPDLSASSHLLQCKWRSVWGERGCVSELEEKMCICLFICWVADKLFGIEIQIKERKGTDENLKKGKGNKRWGDIDTFMKTAIGKENINKKAIKNMWVSERKTYKGKQRNDGRRKEKRKVRKTVQTEHNEEKRENDQDWMKRQEQEKRIEKRQGLKLKEKRKGTMERK